MGTDINCFKEYRDRAGNWHFVAEGPYPNRHSNFFAWLADVRNNVWGEEMPVLVPPRGLPSGVSASLAKRYDPNVVHSASYFTLAELRAGWERTKDLEVWLNGALDPSNPDEKLAAWLDAPEDTRGAPPCGYCSWGMNCQNFRWKETVKELIESSYLELERFLAATAKRRKLSADDVRTVFWFDS